MENKETQTEEFKPVLFVSEYRGFQPMDGLGAKKDKGVICRFTPFVVMHPTFGEITKGHYICLTKEKFDRLVDFGKDEDGNGGALGRSYHIVKKLPLRTNERGQIIRGVGTASAGEKQTPFSDEAKLVARQLGALEARHFTQDSGFTIFKGTIKEASKDRIQKEIDALKKKLDSF